jgi:outer membrane protein assembly factor BamB
VARIGIARPEFFAKLRHDMIAPLRCFLPLIAFAIAFSARADNWPRFRGPNGSGLASGDLPGRLTEANRKWSVQLPGVGHGSPVIWGDRVFVLCGDPKTGRRIPTCVSASDGKIQWQHLVEAPVNDHHKFNSLASSTPAVDAEHVYFTWGVPEKLTLLALTHDGKTAWETDLGPVKREHGFGSSPIVASDLVILSNDQEADSHLFAVEAKTGRLRWKLPRAENHSNYSTPCLYTPPGGPPQLVIVSWRLGATGVDLATGKQLWQLPLFAKRPERAVASPSTSGEFVIVNCAFVNGPKHVVMLKPGPEPGSMIEAWRLEKTVPHIPSPILVGDRAFLWSDTGIVTCAELETGRVIYEERVPGDFMGSPVCVGKTLFAVNRRGTVVALAAADQFQVMGSLALGDACQSTPAVAGGRMFIRTWERLHCLAR